MWSWEGSFPQSMGYTPVDPWETPDLYPSLGLITPDSKSEWLWDEEHWRTVSPTEEEYNKHMQNSYNTWKGYRNAINGLYHLSFRMSSPPWYGSLVLETITYTLTCPHVFGDDTAHEIATYWEAPSSGNLAYGVCSKIVFDGEEISDLVFTGGESIAFATIVLDR